MAADLARGTTNAVKPREVGRVESTITRRRWAIHRAGTTDTDCDGGVPANRGASDYSQAMGRPSIIRPSEEISLQRGNSEPTEKS